MIKAKRWADDFISLQVSLLSYRPLHTCVCCAYRLPSTHVTYSFLDSCFFSPMVMIKPRDWQMMSHPFRSRCTIDLCIHVSAVHVYFLHVTYSRCQRVFILFICVCLYAHSAFRVLRVIYFVCILPGSWCCLFSIPVLGLLVTLFLWYNVLMFYDVKRCNNSAWFFKRFGGR